VTTYFTFPCYVEAGLKLEATCTTTSWSINGGTGLTFYRNPSANVFFFDGIVFTLHMWCFGPLSPEKS
jgi:hypothetical protein